MSKYYLVPVTSEKIKLKDKSLFEILGNVDTELCVREKTRIELTYERKECYILQKSGYIQGFNEYTSLLYSERRLPEKLILKKDKDEVVEFFSELKVNSENESCLEVFEVTPKDIQEFLKNNVDYHYKVEKFLKKGLKKGKSFFKRKDSVKRSK